MTLRDHVSRRRRWPRARRRTSGRRRRRRRAASAWWPSSTSRPCSSTSTRSARAAVDRRWAMAIVVRPAASLSSARAMRTSVSASTDEVASSSTRTVGIDQRGTDQGDELALAGRQLGAALADLGVQAVLQRRQPVVEVEVGDRPLEVGVGQPRLGERQVGGDGAVEQERLLRHDDEPLAQLGVGHLRQRHAAEAHAPRTSGRRGGRRGDRASSCPTRSRRSRRPAGRRGCAPST